MFYFTMTIKTRMSSSANWLHVQNRWG